MPPVNDNLANARVITANISYTGETTVGATNEGSPSTPGDEAYDYDDVAVWYRLEWGATGKWRVKVTNATNIFYPSYNSYSSYGSRLYNLTTDPPSDIGDLSGVYEDTPRSPYTSQGYIGGNDTSQTAEHTAGTVYYIRFGAAQSNGYPYTQWTGTYDIEFEFITAPYNPGSPAANDDMSTAQLLAIPSGSIAGTTHGAPTDVGSAWYRWEPAVDVVLKITIEGTENNGWMPYGDMYHLDGADPPTSYADLSNDGWYQYLGDKDPNTGMPLNPGYASFALQGGEVYLMEVYDNDYIFNSDFTIQTQSGLEPSNDRIENATVISPSTRWPQVINSTTVNGSQDYDEVINWDGSMTPSVWYILDNQGPGAMNLKIESLTDGWDVMFETYYKTSDHTQMGVTGMDQLTQDGFRTTKDTHLGYLDLSNYAMYYGFETNNPASSDYAWDPLVGGEKFYIRVIGYNGDGQYDAGSFRLTAFVAPPAVCLDAIDYLNPDSTTASIVSGNVRETQFIPEDQGGVAPHTPKHYSGWLDEQVATLIIPGEDIADSPGLYSVTIKYKNSTYAYQWVAGFRRNGQPLEPGAEMNATPDSTEWMTMMAGAPNPNEIDMLRFLPVQPGDEIQVVVSYNDYDNSPTDHMDVYQVCFQRMLEAVEAPAYSQLTIPDYPMGTTSSDMGTNDQQGDLMIYKDVAPTYTSHRSTNADLVVTDDGVLWCLASWSCDGFSGSRIGPVLQKWDPSSPGWQIVNDDIGGFGVKRAYGATHDNMNGWTLSIDTDGEDIWVCYSVDGGQNFLPDTTSYSTHIKVRKYDVSGNSWSDVGSPFHGSRSDVGSTKPGENAIAVAGDWGETPIIRVSPAGVPWVVFTDAYCPASSPEDFGFWQMRHYVARWTGSTWDVQVLPGPYESDDDYTVHKVQAESCSLGATASSTTYLGVSCVEDTQTTFATDTISFTPAAGKWCFKGRLALDYVSGGSCGIEVEMRKNGNIVPFAGGLFWYIALRSTDMDWTRTYRFNELYVDCNGSDVISIRMRVTGTGVCHAYLDEIVYIDAHRVEENKGFGFNARFSDDGQPQGMLYMHKIEDVGLGENPGVLYMTAYTRPFLTIAERNAATPPLGWASMEALDDATVGTDSMVLPPETDGNYLWNWQTWIYSEWDGSQWVKKWDQLIEENARNHVYVKTAYDSIASTPPLGHAQQGFGGCTDGINNYMTANLFGGQAFGFFGDTIVALKIGAEGFEPFTDGPPGALQGPGYPQGTVFGLSGFSGWSWDSGGRSIHVDVNENAWLAWNGTEGATFNYSDFVAVAANNNMTTQLAGLSGWYAAADENESLGQDNAYMPIGHVVSSPNGDTVYILFDTYIWSDGTGAAEPYTFGVYECPVLPDNKIPLIPVFLGAVDFTRIKFRSFQRGDA